MSRASTPSLMIAKKTRMAGTSPAMTAVRNNDFASFRGLRHGPVAAEVDHRQRGADALSGAVLEADHGVDRNGALAAVDRVDDTGVFFVDDVAADLAGTGQFGAVGVEFLLEH